MLLSWSFSFLCTPCAAEIFYSCFFLSENLCRELWLVIPRFQFPMNTVSVLSLAITSENTLREFPLQLRQSPRLRKRGLCLLFA